MKIRKSTVEDLDKILQIYKNAREFMKAYGNTLQWGDSYPPVQLIQDDIAHGNSYVCEDDGDIVGTFFFNIGDDTDYRVIRNGSWLSDRPYGVIHRIAVAKRGIGVAAFCFEHCLAECGSIRIDTHRENLPMQRALEKCGFVRCGEITLSTGEDRIAFQKEK